MGVQFGDERRVLNRRSLAREFVVSHPYLGEINCLTENVSLNGAFLKGKFSELMIGSTVEISFIKESRRKFTDKATLYRFSGKVMRVEKQGVGVKFLGLTTEIDAAIYDLMHR